MKEFYFINPKHVRHNIELILRLKFDSVHSLYWQQLAAIYCHDSFCAHLDVLQHL